VRAVVQNRVRPFRHAFAEQAGRNIAPRLHANPFSD
jgi:hypothetical protein